MSIKYLALGGLAIGLGFASFNAHAVPAFARQVGVSCSTCHNGNYLALNAFGRDFKLKGYTLTSIKEIVKKGTKKNRGNLSLPELPGISAMVQISTTHLSSDVAGQENDNIRFPQQLSLFLGGRLSNNLGIFSQFTYANGDSGFSMDNTDLRYANSTKINNKSLDYGFTLDNNPTVGDLWNSTPAWGYPYAASDIAPGPAAGDFLSSLGGAVGGVGAYGMLDNKYYGKVSFYRNINVNGVAGGENVIKGTAPYWRFAWQKNFNGSYLMLGTYGISADVFPVALGTPTGIGGPSVKYRDIAVDFQYEKPLSGENSIVMHGSYTYENRTDVAADGSFLAGNTAKWKFGKIDLQYNLNGQWRPGVALFNTTTGNDNLDNGGYIVDLGYFLTENVQLEAQYTAYNKFDGSSTGASDNNSLFFMLWVMM